MKKNTRVSFGAIDPGDRHVGYAGLSFNRAHGRYRFRMGVLERRHRTLPQVVDEVLSQLPGDIIIEDFRFRGVGHQRFSSGQTLRLIGALEYVLGSTDRGYHLVQPGSADTDLPRLHLSPMLNQWRMRFGLHDPNWRHADSAWRALGLHLMQHRFDDVFEPFVRAMMHKQFRPLSLEADTPFEPRTREYHDDCCITPVLWTLPR